MPLKTEGISREELDQMIKLTEEVSNNTLKLISNREALDGTLRAVLGICTLLVSSAVFLSFRLDGQRISESLIQGGMASGILLTGMIAYATISIQRARRKIVRRIEIEKSILRDLMTMTFEARSMLHEPLDSVSQALLDIRLKRIEFAVDT